MCPPPSRSHNIHAWIGHESTIEDFTATLLAQAQLDAHLGGQTVLHREIQGHESAQFLAYFKLVHFHEGTAAAPKQDAKGKLLHLKGTKNVVERQVPLDIDSLNSGDVFILDGGHDVFLFEGNEAGPMERIKGAEVTKAIAAAHTGAVQIHTIAENDDTAVWHAARVAHSGHGIARALTNVAAACATGPFFPGGAPQPAKAFWKFFGGKQPIAAAIPDDDGPHEKHLLRLSDETGHMKMTELKPVSRKALNPQTMFVLDDGSHVFAWIGKEVAAAERVKALAYASDYLFKNKRPKTLPISRVPEGHETEAFLAAINV